MINISNVLTFSMSISNSELKTTLTTFTQRKTELLEKNSDSASQQKPRILCTHQRVNSQQPPTLFYPDSGE